MAQDLRAAGRSISVASRIVAESVLAAIRMKVAQGVSLQVAVDEFAPRSSERNRVESK
jgi:hypothetical protein